MDNTKLHGRCEIEMQRLLRVSRFSASSRPFVDFTRTQSTDIGTLPCRHTKFTADMTSCSRSCPVSVHLLVPCLHAARSRLGLDLLRARRGTGYLIGNSVTRLFSLLQHGQGSITCALPPARFRAPGNYVRRRRLCPPR